ncbi:DUF1351 domain-containing protein [Anaerosacchariphilus polymeriproducens]|uniref:DUF1351 domain-containing protein n=1 Tax=Anaerosacchariphilus polymeriproducens TaxID=1812858 RepID=A0A371ATG1_9FIRM|nr:DUF1351 domain-containing protein [Anaerosacchariphilus polymeriproducens]RDU22854.1 DUF1351 domain-containing protein [Anaerosacchariphilus polymeriproducens]
MSELNVITKQQLGKIDFNFEEIKTKLDEKMKEYEGALFTDESMTVAKKEVASLRKLKKALNDRKIEVKKEYMKPYDDFELKTKELMSLIDKPIELINGQVSDYEARRKQEKRVKISEIYNELSEEIKDCLPLNKIYDTKWENAGTSLKAIREDIEKVAESTLQAIQTINGMNSESKQKALDIYKDTLSLSDAITYINKYEQQKAEILARELERKQIEERRRQEQEIERIRQEERKRIEEENRIREEVRKETEESLLSIKVEESSKQSNTEDNKEVATFRVCGTAEEIEQVHMYLNSIGVEFERDDIE